MAKKAVKCSPDDVAVKSFFLGPQAENSQWLSTVVQQILGRWFLWRQKIAVDNGRVISASDQQLPAYIEIQKSTEQAVRRILDRFELEIPKFSPKYIGHMFSETSMPALIGHIITLLHNPNNISSEASRVGIKIEQEAIGRLGALMGFTEPVGHFTSGGTVANFEFLIRARERWALWQAAALASGDFNYEKSFSLGWQRYHKIRQSISADDFNKYYCLSNYYDFQKMILEKLKIEMQAPVLLVSASMHYSWPKAMHYLGLGEGNIRYIELDQQGRASARALAREIEWCRQQRRPILGVVAIAGTTEMGSIDPIDQFAEVIKKYQKSDGYRLWFHADAAYGGFFRSIPLDLKNKNPLSRRATASLLGLDQCDSVTLDPHKLGYVPYASGVFLCQRPEDYFIKSFSGPYIKSKNEDVGQFTLEGSRSAAGAVATHLSISSLQAVQGYARVLSRSIAVKKTFQRKIQNLGFTVFMPDGLDTNILSFAPTHQLKKLSQINKKTLRIFDLFEQQKNYRISKTTIHKDKYGKLIEHFCRDYKIEMDSATLVMLRLTLMNPFIVSKEGHINHIEQFCQQLSRAVQAGK